MELVCRALLTTIALMALLVSGSAQDMHKGHGGGAQHSRFDDPEKWAKSFDDPERAKWQKPDEVIAALALKSGDKVADIGAGTGYFAMRLAPKVPQGMVYAVDLEPKMVAWLADRATKSGISNLTAVQGSVRSPNLPEAVDIVLLVNVYHHIEKRADYFKGLQKSLRPGARIAIVDFKPEAERGAPKHMRMAAAAIEKEMAAAGYRRSGSHGFLPHQNFQVFQVGK